MRLYPGPTRTGLNALYDKPNRVTKLTSNKFLQILSTLFMGIIIGSLAALAAVGFTRSIAWLNYVLLISPQARLIVENSNILIAATLLVPAIGGLIVGLIHRMIPEKRPHGPADAIQAVQEFGTKMPVKAGVLSALTSLISLGCGASVGQYGPLAHLGASLGSWFSRILRFTRMPPNVAIGCGVAAAISTAFNAPIAGIVFSHEVMLRHYSLRAFAPITIAATIGYIFANVLFPASPLFRIDTSTIPLPYEFIVFALIGISGALVAVFFMNSLLISTKIAGGLNIPAWSKPMLAGLLLGIIALQIPEVLGIGKAALRFGIIEGAYTPTELAITLIAKIAVTALCIGFGFAGGIFSPSLLIGVLFGAFCWSVGSMFGLDQSPIVIYAIAGMVAITSPVIGAPLTTILIVYELTRNYDLTTAAMVSAVCSNMVAYRMFGRSMFDIQLKKRGFDLSLGRDKVVLDRSSISPFIQSDYIGLLPETTLKEAKVALLEEDSTECYIRDGEGRFQGTVTLPQIIRVEMGNGDLNQSVEQIAVMPDLVLYRETSVWSAMGLIEGFVGESIPVLNSLDNPILEGVIFEASLVDAYMRTTYQIRQDENAM